MRTHNRIGRSEKNEGNGLGEEGGVRRCLQVEIITLNAEQMTRWKVFPVDYPNTKIL